MDHIPLAIDEEVALEGLDGITLESFWFRMSERLKLPLPFYENFKKQLWNIILKRDQFDFYEIEKPRKTVGRLDRLLYLKQDEKAREEVKEFYHIYSYDPVDDPKVRGSCKEFKTRVKLDRNALSALDLCEIANLYGNKLVIVASQKLRNTVLIPSNICRDCDINNHTYCILERIARSREFGETTSGPFSLLDYVKDLKLLHYFRSFLIKNNLVIRQQICQKINGKTQVTQIFHVPKYFLAVSSTELLHIEKVFAFLLSKPNNIATHDEIRSHIDMKNQKIFSALMRSRPEIFEYRKFPYRDIYPNADKKTYASKNGNEKQLLGVKLVDPNMDMFQLYEIDDSKDEKSFEEEHEGFLDCSKQELKLPLVYKVIEGIEKSGNKGMSQSEVGKYFGLSRLNSRAVLRKAQKCDVTTYMKDEGRQRTSMYICKKFSNEKSLEIVNQVAKLFKKAEEITQPTVQVVPYQKLDDTLVPEPVINEVPNPIENSPTKVSIPLSVWKQEMSTISDVIQYVQPQTVEQQAQSQIIEMPTSDDANKVVLIPTDYSFVDNVENVEVSLKFLNNIPGMQKQSRGLQEDLAKNRVSEKVLARMNIILDEVKKKTVMDSVNLLMAVRKLEANFTEIICRKSLLALCSRLAADNFIKVIEMEMTSPTKTVKQLFFGEPNVTFDMRCWHSIIEEQKIQNFITSRRSAPELHVGNADLVHTNSFASKTSVGCDELGAQSTLHENFPKFIKYKLFHEFLYYLIYGYPAEVDKIHVRKAVEVWRRENQRLTDYEEIAEKISICYSTDINWKMFIPPLNPQLGYEEGWGFLRDIIHRIPLILYVKFTRFVHFSSDINEYLSHPIKSNYLLHFLPPKIFAELTQGRKYIGVISELCKRLCMMGLLQFGPLRTKELDQTFVYLNRNAMLLDTRSSSPGYLEVSEKEYPRLLFHFDSAESVNNYWATMHDVCVNTRINQKATAFGQTIILEPLNAKPDLLKALKPQASATAAANDIGEIPGDRKGAGGLDKGFMAHLKQNWTKSIGQKKRPISALAVERKPRPVKKPKIKAEPKKKKSAKVKAATKEIQKSKSILQSNFKGVNSKSKIIRKVKPKKQTVKELKKKAELYDDIDKEALKLMKTLRVTWSEIEDKTLMLSKVAMKFAFPNDNQCAHYINFGLIRDVLHWRTEKALNKTSRACQRRIVHLFKHNKGLRNQASIHVEELKANREFSNKYGNFVERLKRLYTQEQIYLAIKVHMVEMIHKIHQIFLKEYISNPVELPGAVNETFMQLPDNYEALDLSYKIISPYVSSMDDSKYQEPTNGKEIQLSILTSLIHSALCSSNDKTSNTYFLREIYSKFSDESLGAAVNLLRRLAIISLNKNQRCVRPIMPETIRPQFHLSNRYESQLLSVAVPVELYSEYLAAVREVSAGGKDIYHMKNINCGWIFMIAELINENLISLKSSGGDKTMGSCGSIGDGGSARRKTNFEKISDNYYLMMENQKEINKDLKKIKTVRFHADSNSDEKFIYNDDPIEIFCKCDIIYLHIFCILQAIEHHENIEINELKFMENDKCSLKNCIIRSGDNFSIEVQKIACHGYEIIRYILTNSDQGPSSYDENSITKFNLVKYFDTVIDKYINENAQNERKNLGKIDSDIKQKINTKFLLENIRRIATEVENEDGAWLSEYKKISHNKTDEDEEVFYDEDDKSMLKLTPTPSSKDITTSQNKIQDSFIVNLSSLHLRINAGYEEAIIDGNFYNKNFLPFDEKTHTKIIEDFKIKHIWVPEDFEKKTLTAKLLEMSEKVSQYDKKQMQEMCDFLKAKGQAGAKMGDLLGAFGAENKELLHEKLVFLEKLKFVLRTGVNEIRFVHRDFAGYWLIDAFYLSDVVKKPKIEESTQQVVVVESHSTAVDKMATEKSQSEADKQPQPKSDDKQPPQVELDTNYKRNPYYLIPCPWMRVGSIKRALNRRCFDKWLGTVLNHLAVNPGTSLTDLCSKFNVITPVHVRSLCEILEAIECIKLMAFPELDVNIFSDYDTHYNESKPATYLDPFNRTYIEVLPDAIRRLTFFIGKKKYVIPFI